MSESTFTPMRRTTTIRARLLLGFGALVLLLITAGVLARASMSATATTVDHVLEDIQRENRLAAEFTADIARGLGAANAYLATHDSATGEAFRRFSWDAHDVQRQMNALPRQSADEIALISDID